jgi:hypothetical protein
MEQMTGVNSSLDPLDLEIVERALDSISDSVRAEAPSKNCDAFEANLRRELITMVRSRGVSDPEALWESLVAEMTEKGVRLSGRSEKR